jgi:hypothetical protein
MSPRGTVIVYTIVTAYVPTRLKRFNNETSQKQILRKFPYLVGTGVVSWWLKRMRTSIKSQKPPKTQPVILFKQRE